MKTHHIILAASISTLLAAAAHADTFTWDGVTGDWTNSLRWSPAGVPSFGDDAIIAAGGAYTVSAIGNLDINTLIFSAPGATLFLEARTATSTASLSFGGGLVNGNAIVLDSASTSSLHGAVLSVVSGTLENGVGKSIQLLGNGTGKSRTVNADVNNAGSFTVGADALGLLTRGTGIFTNTGTVSVAGSGSLEFGSASVFNQNAGSLSVSGLFEMAADTFNFNGGTVTGNAPVLVSSTLNIGAGAGAGAFSMQGGSGVISGDVLAAHTIDLTAITGVGGATVTASNGFTNSGLIRMDSASTSVLHGTNLIVAGGTLTNAASGELRFAAGGTSKVRSTSLDLENNGLVSIVAGADAQFTKGTGVTTNNATLSIGAGASLSFGSASVFNQNGGVLTNNGAFDMSADTFNFNGGALAGNAPVLLSSTLNIGVGSTGAGTFIMRGGSGDFSGDIAPAQTVNLQGFTGVGSATVASAGSFTNHGNLVLDSTSTSASHGATFTVTAGTLTNAADGTITLAGNGAGKNRTINADVANAGTFAVAADASGLLTKGSGVFTNTGTFTIAPAGSVAFGSPSTFNQNGGVLTNNGAFDMSTDTFNFNGGTLAGNAPVLISSTLNIGVGSTGAGTFIMRGGSGDFSGDIAPAQTVNLEATTSVGQATVTSAGSFTNHGNLVLDSTSTSALHGATFNVTAGTLTNAADGTITLAGNGAGKNRTLNADIANAGTFAVAADANGLLTRGTGIVTNTGAFTIAPGGSVAFGSFSTFNQNGGVLTNNGAFDMSTDTFNFNGGALAGNAPVLISSTLNIGVGSTGAGTFIMRGSSGDFSGDIAPAQTVNLEATTAIGSATVTSAGSFTNHGNLVLDSTSTSALHAATFTVTAGTLTIGATGTLDAARNGGASASRNLNATLDNDGLVTIHDGATLNLTKASGVHLNDGTLHIGSGSKLELLGSGTRTLTNHGSITGTGILDVNASGASFLNSGLIEPGESPGILTIEGNAPFDDNASLGIELGGLIVGTEYDRLVVVGDLLLDGDLLVTLLPGFIPAPGDSFTIITTSGAGNEITGTFDNAPGGIVPFPGGSATVTYNTTSVVLSNVVPEPSSALLLLSSLGLLARRRR